MAGSIFLEKVKSESLAHLSFIIGHDGKAAVIDPRRDCEVYVDIAQRNGARITHIFETHRNEDYVIGSRDLARRTGAAIFHGKNLNFAYGHPVSEGDTFVFGNIQLSILETPGHTFESISIVMKDKSTGDRPIGVFTGDALFIGSVGRTDFFPDRAREVAGLQYDSIFKKILPLGDQVILYPAHGAGSVCGSGMADREFSTLGYEKMFNPALQVPDREAFIDRKVAEKPHQPPYFRKMEEYNQQGNAPILDRLPKPPPQSPSQFSESAQQGAQILDLRSPEAFAGAFVPGSLAIPLEMVPAYGGYFLSYERPIGLIAHSYDEIETAVRFLIRMGYDQFSGFLSGGLHAWEVSGRDYDRIPAVHVKELSRRLKEKDAFTLLDVREEEELQEVGKFPGAHHIFLGDLPHKLDAVPKGKPVTTFCGSGMRAIIAASILKQNGFDVVEDSLGSMAACLEAGCPIEEVD
ncbi:MAG: metallo-beta-lactamase [Desulfatitalea sp. BRH_c12]|nr:MAG: metallo-beta-lactamase [Desulfatitalea sp. BRH_c12]